MTLHNIGIILARGNSKRIPRKNILEFNGKPLISWTIEAAIKANIFDKVLVSTDNEEIAEISRKYGAEVPFLRSSATDDFSSSSEATFVALKQAEEYWEVEFNLIAQMMANCPLRNECDIKNSFTAFKKSNSLSQISCFKFGWMNPWWAFKLDENMKPDKLFPESLNKRSQDLPDLYCPTGAIWFAKRNEFIKTKDFYLLNPNFHPIDWTSAVDIDNLEDFEMAKITFEMKNKTK